MTTTSDYADFVKPLLAARLRAAGLDRSYHKALGDSLFYKDNNSGQEIEVLDLVGGFGAGLVGHNHPRIQSTVREFLDGDRVIHGQASLRESSGRLARALSACASSSVGEACITTFANSGTEAVEAAIKHAELERRQRVDHILDDMQANAHRIRVGLREHRVNLPERLFEQAAKLFGLADITGLDDLFVRIARANMNLFEQTASFIAIEGAFHGKTSGSLQLTYRAEYQAPWRGLGTASSFLPMGDLGALAQFLKENTISYVVLEANEEGEVALQERSFINIAACFVEPIQGEGGVREIDHSYLAALREACDEGGFPLIMDEIQTGMGRTGRFFASEHAEVSGDYYLLSKALGGSMAKISALMVRQSRYVEEFGYLHTSTFAEDDLSAEVALQVLALMEEDELPKRCESIGNYLLDQIRSLQVEFPEQIRDVRGRGLMIGVELASQEDSSSALIRVLSEQDLLGFMVSGYLLCEEQIRVAPTLSARATIRVEPSAYFRKEQADLFCSALRRLLQCLRDDDVHALTRFLVGRAQEVSEKTATRATRPSPIVPSTASSRVGFLCHFLEAEDLRAWDRGLEGFSPEDCQLFLDRTRGMLDPFVVGRTQLQSTLGQEVHATIVGIPFTPSQVIESMRQGEGEWGIELIEKGVEYLRRSGCSVVGFGGYTSIITNNCRAIVASDLALTSGNSLTAAAALDAVFLAANRLELSKRILGVVGAAGNIGRVLAEVAADDVDEIVLVGRKRALRRLRKTAAILYGNSLRKRRGNATTGLAKSIEKSGVLKDVDLSRDAEELGERILQAFEVRPSLVPPVRISDEMGSLRECNLIITATNSAKPVIHADCIAEQHPVVVCDVAVPFDVSPALAKERPLCVVLRGGMIKAPLDQSVDVPGMNLRPGEIYGCLGETLLMGLAGIGENFSFGALSPLRVRHVRELAQMHGFSVEENPL